MIGRIDARGAANAGAALAAVMCLVVGAFPRSVAAQQPGDEIVIRNATVLTVSHGRIDGGSVLMRGGKIVSVGKNVKASPGATVVDATGKFVTPGIVDCHSHIAIDGSVNEGSLVVTSMCRIGDVLDPTDDEILYGLSGGVTTANVLHGSANPIGGLNQVIKLRWGGTADDLVFANAPPGIKFALGENPKRSNFQINPARYPKTRMGVEDVLRDAFTRARDYKAEWDAYRADVAAGKKNLLEPRRDLQLDPLVEVLEGKRMVHAHCYRADEILMLLRVAKEFGFRIQTLQHVLEGYKIAKEIAAAGVGASTFSDLWAYKVEAYDATPYNAALMWKAGILVSLNSDDGERQRRLNTDAARVVRYGGVPDDEALKMITINPARQLGVDKWVGSLDEGKDADVVIWTGDPLSAYSIAEKVYVDGKLRFDREMQHRESDAARREADRLIEQEKERSKPKKPGEGGEHPEKQPKIGDLDDRSSGRQR